jgi:hypothetical protein
VLHNAGQEGGGLEQADEVVEAHDVAERVVSMLASLTPRCSASANG